jgi:hypothetical protein
MGSEAMWTVGAGGRACYTGAAGAPEAMRRGINGREGEEYAWFRRESGSMLRSAGESTSGASGTSGWTRRGRARMGALRVALLALLGLWLGGTAVTAPRASADDKKPSLHIVMPIPAGNGSTVEGPVGTNVSVQGEGLTANAQYQVGYARKDIGCQQGMRSFDNVSPAPAQQDGTLTATVTWPDSLNSIGSTYVICAQNASQLGEPVVQSDESFRVDSADHPQFTLKAAATSATGTATPQPDGTFYLGQQVAITGKNFLPAGSKLVAYLLTGQAGSPSGLLPPLATPLTTSAAITSQSDGGVTATVTLPDNIPTGSYFIYLVSDKGTSAILPALVASQPITIAQAPAAQPTATVAPRPTATATATTKTSGGQPIAAIAGLGGLSVVLFIAGVALLASAAAMSRPDR